MTRVGDCPKSRFAATGTRRQFILAAASVGSLLPLQACTPSGGSDSYEAVIKQTWRHAGLVTANHEGLLRELVRYATLAPSSHNTQCWRFRVQERSISILPDLSRRCPVVDPDDHHLFVSLGCAAENLAHAALAYGLTGETVVEPESTPTLIVGLEPTQAVASALYEAIPRRQCTRTEYDGKPLSVDELRLLERAGTGRGVRVLLLTNRNAMEEVLEYVTQGNTAQLNDPAFVAELKTWIRFSDTEAVRSGDGLFSRASGNPSVPRWLGSQLFGWFMTAHAENDKYARHVRSSAGIAVLVSEVDDKAHWVEAGRCYERFALQATALGIRNALLNQPVEVAALRPQFASAFGLGLHRPDLIVRFGRGPEMPRSLRRPVDAVLA